MAESHPTRQPRDTPPRWLAGFFYFRKQDALVENLSPSLQTTIPMAIFHAKVILAQNKQ